MADHLTNIEHHFNRVSQTLDAGSRSASIAFIVATEDVKQLKNHVLEVIEEADLIAAEKNEQIKRLLSEAGELQQQVAVLQEEVAVLKQQMAEKEEARTVGGKRYGRSYREIYRKGYQRGYYDREPDSADLRASSDDE